MNRSIAMLIIGLVFGGGLGFVLAAANGVTLDGHDHAKDHELGVPGSVDHSASHAHDAPLVVASDHAPAVLIEAFPDPVGGWNLSIETANFTFSPMNAGFAHVDGEGHAHIYANGKKLGRVYGGWVHLDKLPEGEVEVMVTLNSNDHRPLVVGDTPISASVTLSRPSGG